MKRRLLNKMYAEAMGYFWLPCPLCGKMFGGHEAYWSLETSMNTGKAVCPDCAAEAESRNIRDFENSVQRTKYSIQCAR